MTAAPAPGTPPDLVGPVRRTLLVDVAGRRDTTTTVVWFQGPGRLYVDLRRPPAPAPPVRDGLAALRSAADLATAPDDVLAHLANYEGFAGRFTLATGPVAHPAGDEAERRGVAAALPGGGLARWERLVDLHPATGVPDEGTLVRQGDVLVETGLHAPYVEHWLPEPDAVAAVGAAAVLLEEPGTGRAGVVVRVGARFAVASARARGLPSGTDLATLLRAAAPDDRATVLDCETALGRVDPDGRWVVELSNLPWREGTDLDPADDGGTLTTTTPTPTGDVRRRWRVVEREGAALVTHRRPVGPASSEALQDNDFALTPGGAHGAA